MVPTRPSFEGEVEKWKIKFDQRESPSVLSKYSLSDALKDADKEFSPNIHEIMKLILTLPVGSVPCEHSFSAMREPFEHVRKPNEWSCSTLHPQRYGSES